MANHIRKVTLGAKLLSYCGVAILVLTVILMINTIIAMLTDYSVIDRFPTTLGNAIAGVAAFALFLVLGVGNWLVTIGDERIKSLALININRLLARGFYFLVLALWGLMSLGNTLPALIGVQPMGSDSGSIMHTFSAVFPLLLTACAGCTALHYVWLYYEFKLFTRNKARWSSALLIMGGLALVVETLTGTGPSNINSGGGPPSMPFLLLSLVSTVAVLASGFMAIAMIIGMPRALKSMRSTCELPATCE